MNRKQKYQREAGDAAHRLDCHELGPWVSLGKNKGIATCKMCGEVLVVKVDDKFKSQAYYLGGTAKPGDLPCPDGSEMRENILKRRKVRGK